MGVIDPKEIRYRLAARVEEVCHLLLPGGKRDGANYRAASTSGGAGESLGVQLVGPRTGFWKDFSTDEEKGDLLDLWRFAKGMTFRDAFADAKKWLGIAIHESNDQPQKKYSKPSHKGVMPITAGAGLKVQEYLTKERKLSLEVLEAYKVRAAEDDDGVGGVDIIFPCKSPSGELINIKKLGLDRTWDEEKKKWKKVSRHSLNTAHILFGWQAVDKDAKAILITEGEIDAMTWWDWGMKDTVSVPGGAANFNWIDLDWDHLEAFETIYLGFDNDEEGQMAAAKAAKRLGLHRCRIVKLPFKDANECLLKGVTPEQASRCLIDSQPISPREIKSAGEFRDVVHQLFSGQEDESVAFGLKTPIFGRRLRFRPSEMTLWTGHTGHGKSTLLSQICIHAMLADQKVAIGSFEVKGGSTIKRMCCCIGLKQEPSTPEINTMIDWLSRRLWIYDVIGQIKRDHLFELMLYSIMRHDVQHIVIDSLMKCDMNSEDYEEQRNFLNRLHEFALEHNVHLHVVGHPRKGKDDESPPGIMDVHGGQSIIAQPDNVVCVWRHKKKEKEREDGSLNNLRENSEPDTVAYVHKQRGGDGEDFKVRLWFKKKCNRFTTNYGGSEPHFEDFEIIKPNTVIKQIESTEVPPGFVETVI